MHIFEKVFESIEHAGSESVSFAKDWVGSIKAKIWKFFALLSLTCMFVYLAS